VLVKRRRCTVDEVAAGGATLGRTWWTYTEDRISDCLMKQMGSCRLLLVLPLLGVATLLIGQPNFWLAGYWWGGFGWFTLHQALVCCA
jgi:hypothetical protein